MGLKDKLTKGRAEVEFDGHTIVVESKTGKGIGNHHQLFVDGKPLDVDTTFFGDYLDGTLVGADGTERSFKVRIEQGLNTHYTLLIDGQEINMGKSFVA
jgi:hypothetical protein